MSLVGEAGMDVRLQGYQEHFDDDDEVETVGMDSAFKMLS